MSQPPIRVVIGTWDALRTDASGVRQEVFVVEQGVPAEIELDEFDSVCVHAVAYGADGRVLGTGRLLPDGHIGRMAVHRNARGHGVGGRILQSLVDAGREAGHRILVLNAQTHAKGFYETHGFAVRGDEFVDAGMPHVEMARVLFE